MVSRNREHGLKIRGQLFKTEVCFLKRIMNLQKFLHRKFLEGQLPSTFKIEINRFL